MEAVKLKLDGWLEDGEQYSNIIKICPKCKKKLRVTDSLQLCNILMVWCPDYKCRWCELYEL